jgi:hypothetical protein
MKLLPAIRHQDRIVVGTTRDSHATLEEAHGLTGGDHGFTPDGKLWVTRKQAPGWIKRYEPGVFTKLGTLPADGLHTHIYARAKGIKQKDLTDTVDISNKTCIVYDRGGLYTYRAQDLGRDFGKVLYYIPDASAYPESPKAQIGTGLPEITRIDDKRFYKELNKADLIYFPDAYDGALQNYLRKEGHRVFGSGLCEKMEIDKIFFLEALERAGLPIARTYLAKGTDDLLEYVKGKGKKWLKGLYRGDWETRSADDADTLKSWIEHEVIPRIGAQGAETVKILVQDPVKSACEVGYDGMQIDGDCIDDCLIGYEVKDAVYVAKVFDKVPEVVKRVNDKMAPEFRAIGDYRGDYSTELRITEGGKAYYIDATCRSGSPPGELFSSICDNYSKAAWLIAKGIVPRLHWRARYGAEIILKSKWYEKNPLIVKFPDEFYDNIKLKQHTKRNGMHTCIPNGNGEYFGAAVAWADSREKAMEKCMEIAKSIQCEDFEYKGGEGTFKEADEAVEAGERFGVKF